MYDDIQKRISQKSTELGRDVPVLIAVSKMQPLENVEAVLSKGHQVFGENRVQEAASKWPDLQGRFGAVELHLLGPLQSNKLNAALKLFQYIHSLDRLSLAEKLARATQGAQCPQLFVQVNIGKEPQKSGIMPEELPQFLRDVAPLDLPIIGLMCIPPAGDDPRPYFQDLRLMAHDHGLKNLSMGMSDDFEIAIEEGATHIRVGSAIFGARDYTN